MSSPILNVTARKIIESAYRSAGLTPAEQTVTSYEVGRGVEVMNFIIKAWQSQGHHLWSETEAIIPLNVGQQKYLVGPNGDEIATEESFFFTNTEADQVATDTVISVFDASGFVLPESILSFSPTDSTQDWTAINSGLLTSDGTTLNIENGAAAAGGGSIGSALAGASAASAIPAATTGALAGGLSPWIDPNAGFIAPTLEGGTAGIMNAAQMPEWAKLGNVAGSMPLDGLAPEALSWIEELIAGGVDPMDAMTVVSNMSSGQQTQQQQYSPAPVNVAMPSQRIQANAAQIKRGGLM